MPSLPIGAALPRADDDGPFESIGRNPDLNAHKTGLCLGCGNALPHRRIPDRLLTFSDLDVGDDSHHLVASAMRSVAASIAHRDCPTSAGEPDSRCSEPCISMFSRRAGAQDVGFGVKCRLLPIALTPRISRERLVIVYLRE